MNLLIWLRIRYWSFFERNRGQHQKLFIKANEYTENFYLADEYEFTLVFNLASERQANTS